MGQFKDLSGLKFNRLTVISRVKNIGIHPVWLCKSDCGKDTFVTSTHLKTGHTKSCGCLVYETAYMLNKTHGKSKTGAYITWCKLLQRCTNHNNPRYKDYGGRGITVCEEWLKFENFFNDMGERPKGLSIDRIDNNKGYYKENCRWSDSKTQNNNKRNKRLIMLDGKTLSITQWEIEIGLTRGRLWARLESGWDIKKALSLPAMQNFKRDQSNKRISH